MFFWSHRHADRAREYVWHVALPLALGGLTIPVALYLWHPIAVMVPVILTAIGIYGALPFSGRCRRSSSPVQPPRVASA